MPSLIERVAMALEPETFRLPKINLHKRDYERAYASARAAIEAMKYDDWDEDYALDASGQERLDTVGFICAYDRFLDLVLATPN